MRIVKWSGQSKVDFVNMLGHLYQHWTEKEAQSFINEITKLTYILEKGNVEFKKIKNGKLHVAVISEYISVYNQVFSDSKVEFVRVWNNRQKPSRLIK
jgi:hypothetical protein